MLKKELLEYVESLKSKIKILENNDSQEVKKRNEELIQEIFDKNKEIASFKEKQEKATVTFRESVDSITKNQNEKFEKLKNEYDLLQKKFNELAQIFDEYIKSSDDIIELSKLGLRNQMRNKELMSIKIQEFNNSYEGGNK